MSIVLLLVGLLATAAGLVTIGFGIPINAFSLGNTLIIAGTVAVSAGLVLIGLAAVLGQLRRINEALAAQPFARAGRLPESVESLVPSTARMAPAAAPPPVPGRPPPQPAEMRGPHPPEPRQPEADLAPIPNEPPTPLDWLRAKPRPAMPTPSAPVTAAPAEPPVVELSDEAPLSPRPPQRPQQPPPAAEPAHEPRGWPLGRAGAPTEPARRPEQPMPRATPQAEPAKDKHGFDMVWPEHQAAPASGGAPAASETTETPAPVSPFRPRESRPADRRTEPGPRPATDRPPAILKSGVIDGMPYTLYADGSIEAELPHGTVKFASVDALRAHLEKQSS